MNRLRDNILLGIFLGMLGPLLAATGFYLVKFGHSDVLSFLQAAFKEKIFSPLLSLCALVNLGTFYLFLNYEKYLVARGIIFSTFVYGAVIVILKFML